MSTCVRASFFSVAKNPFRYFHIVSLNTFILDDLVSFHNPLFLYAFLFVCVSFVNLLKRGVNSIKSDRRNKIKPFCSEGKMCAEIK